MIKDEISKDMQLLNSITAQICDYAVDNDIQPNDAIKTVAENLLSLCKIANFNNWHKEGKKNA